MNQQIVQFTVPMHHLLLIKVAKTCNYLPKYLLSDALVEEATHVFDQLFEVSTIAELLHLVEILFLVVEELNVLHYVVIGELFHDLQLHPDALPSLRVQLCVICPHIRSFSTFHSKICLVRVPLRLDYASLHSPSEYFQQPVFAGVATGLQFMILFLACWLLRSN